jgi:hypothetical protein
VIPKAGTRTLVLRRLTIALVLLSLGVVCLDVGVAAGFAEVNGPSLAAIHSSLGLSLGSVMIAALPRH